MKVSDLLASRRTNWRELDDLCSRVRTASRNPPNATTVARFSALYRAVCADLALADAYQLPPGTVRYLHRLVGRAHNQLYRSQTFNFSTWTRQLLVDVPQRLFRDGYLRLAFCLFWGMFLLSAYLAYTVPGFAEDVVGAEMLQQLEEDFSQPVYEYGPTGRAAMVGFYIFNNAGIGLKCFSYGLILGVGGLYDTVFNAVVLGAVFGHMATVPQWEHFSEFVTAHGPFELTAIVLSAAAGMRLGFSMIQTRGLTRIASLRRAGRETMPIVCAALILFVLAALIEGFLSPSAAPYWIKAAVAVLSTALLMFYFVGLGYPRRRKT